MTQVFKFIVAALLAVTYACFTGKCRDRVVGFFIRIRSEPVDKSTARARLRACKDCGIYYAPLQTCGSPLVPDRDLGCHCFMPYKVKTKTNCWAYDLAGQDCIGRRINPWGDLNSFP